MNETTNTVLEKYQKQFGNDLIALEVLQIYNDEAKKINLVSRGAPAFQDIIAELISKAVFRGASAAYEMQRREIELKTYKPAFARNDDESKESEGIVEKHKQEISLSGETTEGGEDPLSEETSTGSEGDL